MSLPEPEQPRHRAGSIPVQQPISDGPANRQSLSDMLYRGGSLCSCTTSSSSSTSSKLTSESDSLSRPSTKDQSRLSQSPSRRDNNVQHQQDQPLSGDKTSSTTSSVNSSNSSMHENLGSKSHDNDMLSVDNNISSSSSSSRSGSISLAAATGEAPMLPTRSARRASRLITPIPPKKTASDERPMLPHAAPHQIYLSSEEDASSSADDFSDFEEELDSDSQPSQRTKDTARMVAVIFYGKPSIVTLSPRRSISPSSSNGQQTGAGILRTLTEPALSRPRSVSSTSSTTTLNHPPRSSSMMTAGLGKKRPGFLHIDPHAKGNDANHETARTPKTPTTMLRKTLNLVKKRSKQNLHQSESLITPMEQVSEVEEEEEDDPRESICLESPTLSSVSHQDIVKGAKRNASLSVPRSEVSSPKSPKNRFRTGLLLTRQRSVRA
ncbi:hypothetical protein EsDP_00005021 [Epichloe bromicola]|uniref:Uncharacterized protein n=1 Tax=Epichloe bromicola TaxID=79588 RepID=A0ABQ0CTE8_9HYPO